MGLAEHGEFFKNVSDDSNKQAVLGTLMEGTLSQTCLIIRITRVAQSAIQPEWVLKNFASLEDKVPSVCFDREALISNLSPFDFKFQLLQSCNASNLVSTQK